MAPTRSALLEDVEKLATPILAEKQIEWVYAEYMPEHGQWILRLYVDKPGGVTLDDCAWVSSTVGRALDATDLIGRAYSLEVSSPGICRPLRKEADFERFKGQRVDVTLYAPQDGRRHFRAILDGIQDGRVQVTEDGQKFEIPLASIAKAKLDPEIDI